MEKTLVVLAGGLATRLGKVTKKIPKSLIEINDKPFILKQLELFRKYKIQHVHFCLGHLGEMIQEVVDKSNFGKCIKITYSFDGDTALGTGGAVKKSLKYLSEVFFVTYGDSYLDINYSEISQFFLKHADTDNGLMTVYKNDNKFDTSNVIIQNNRIFKYSKSNILETMNYIDYGLGILRKSHLKTYQNGESFDLSEIYEKLADESKLLAYQSLKRFYEIGSFQGIRDLSYKLNP